MGSPIVTAAELAKRLGIDRKTLYRAMERMERDDGLPKPLTARGRYKWDRPSIDAWFSRHHPAMGKPANDLFPTPPDPDPDDVAAWSKRISDHYRNPR